MTATTHGASNTPILASCRCGDDPQLQLLGNYPSDHASRDVWSTWAAVEVRRLGNALLRQLGLPELPLLEEVA